MAKFRLVGNGLVTIRIQALDAGVVTGGTLIPLTPAIGAAIEPNRLSASVLEWQIPVTKDSGYDLQILVPKRAGVPLNQHRILRTVSQLDATGTDRNSPPASTNPRNTAPQSLFPGNQAIYSEVLSFQ